MLFRYIANIFRSLRVTATDAEILANKNYSDPQQVLEQFRTQAINAEQIQKLEQHYQSIIDSVKEYSKEMGRHNVNIRLTMYDSEAIRSREGRNYVLINKNNFEDVLRSAFEAKQNSLTLNFISDEPDVNFWANVASD